MGMPLLEFRTRLISNFFLHFKSARKTQVAVAQKAQNTIGKEAFSIGKNNR